jgi:hypothetical protein
VQRVVLVGFSAGGLSSLLAAGAPGVMGYVGRDPFDTVQGGGTLGRDFAPGLRTEALLLRAPPSRCNAQAVAAPWGGLLPRLLEDRLIEGGVALRLRVADGLDVQGRVRGDGSEAAGRSARGTARGGRAVAAASAANALA